MASTLASVTSKPVLTPADDFSTAALELPGEQPFSGRVKGLSVTASVVNDESALSAVDTDGILIRAVFSVSSASYGVEPFTKTRVVPLEDYKTLQSRLESLAPYGEDFYDDEQTSQRVWEVYARLLKEAATAPDLGSFLQNSTLGNVLYQQEL